MQNEWNKKGEEYAQAVDKMVEIGEKIGWENWSGAEPVDERSHLAENVLEKLREANKNKTVEQFRNEFPPAHVPFAEKHNENGQFIGDFCLIKKNKIAFMSGTAYQKRAGFILEDDRLQKLPENITSIGKAVSGSCVAIATDEKISTYANWEGELISEFAYPWGEGFPITQLIPFNDGKQVLLVTSEGIYLLSSDGSKLIHPVEDDTDDEWEPSISMEHAALSPENDFICAGDQGSQHRILDRNLAEINDLYPESSYPHFALFSKDGSQLIMNSCHFYNGVTIGVSMKDVVTMKDLKDQQERTVVKDQQDRIIFIDDECRVYSGISTKDYYILGDAFGYIRAFDFTGRKIWRHFLGSTISGLAISEDENILYVGSYSGILHKLHLGKGVRDSQTIGNGNHFEEFRMIFWKNEQQPLKW